MKLFITILVNILISISITTVLSLAVEKSQSESIRTFNIKQSDSIPKVKYLYFNNNNGLKLSDVDEKNWLAKGSILRDDFNETGWYILEIESNANFNDSTQAFAVGYLEANLTSDLIALNILNLVDSDCNDPKDEECNKLKNWLGKNFEWMLTQIEANRTDPYWHQVELVLEQFTGLVQGYYGNDTLVSSLREFFKRVLSEPKYLKLLLLNMGGDVSELIAAIDGTVDPFYAGSCSALVKVLDNNADIFISHVTWDGYNTMLRILKRYKFHFHLNDIDPVEVPGYDITLSSYPGMIVSVDDFYLSSANMAIIETTIGNANADLWKHVTTETILYWIRIGVANRLAYTGPDWARIFSLYNSGTYNNEWMILDYKQFVPGDVELRDNLFIVLEQIPGTIEWADKTDVLRTKSFWPSYNIAYYPNIYNLSGTYDSYVKYGDFFSYENTSRAKIFNRGAGNVKDMDSMISLMRYNNYTYDEYSKCDCKPPFSSELAISARSDLNPEDGTYPFEALGHRQHGAIDMKVTSFKMARDLDFVAISGPTYNQNIEPFVWSKSDFDKKVSHVGLPDKYEFPPYKTKWNL